MNIPTLEELKLHKMNPRYCEYHYPEFFKYLKDNYTCKFSAGCYLYFSNSEEPKCPVCGGSLKFLGIGTGFREFCSNRCQSIGKREQREQTMLKKYGVKTPLQSKKHRAMGTQTCLKKYGTVHPMQSKQIQEKSKQTCLEKYGVEHISQSQQIKDKVKQTFEDRHGGIGLGSPTIGSKIKQTIKELYGTESPTQNEAIKQKVKQTNIERYGGIGFGSPETKEKIINTIISRFGCDNAMHNDTVKSNLRQTCIDKYGSPYPISTADVREKIKQTSLVHYGVENPFGSPEIQEKIKSTMISRYGVERPLQSEEIRRQVIETMQKIYGVNYPAQSVEIQEKTMQTCMDRYGKPYGFLNTCPGYSKISQLLFDELKNYFPNAVYATNIGEYKIGPYLLDWYDPDTNTAIEFNGDEWHANPKTHEPGWIHPVKKCTAQSIWEKDIKKMEYLMSQGIDVYVIWESDYVNENIKLDEFVNYIQSKHERI